MKEGEKSGYWTLGKFSRMETKQCLSSFKSNKPKDEIFNTGCLEMHQKKQYIEKILNQEIHYMHRADAPRTIVTTAILTLILLVTVPAAAQLGSPYSINIFAGFSLPVGDYSSTSASSANDFLNASGNTPGFAQLGFNGGIEYTLRIHSPYEIGILGSVSVNGTDEGALRRISSDVSSNTSGGTWYLYSALLSGGVGTDLTPELGIHGRIYAGFTGGSSAEFSFYNLNGSGGYVIQKSTWASTFGYGIGTGITLSNSWDINLRYLASNPEYTSNWTDGRQITDKKFTQPSGILTLTLGLILK